MNLSTAARNAMIAIFGAMEDLKMYSGTMPANADATVTGTLLVNCSDSILNAYVNEFGYASGVATLSFTDAGSNNYISGSVPASGTIGYARAIIYNPNAVANYAYDLTVGTVGSGADIELSSLSVVTADTVKINSLALTMPAS